MSFRSLKAFEGKPEPSTFYRCHHAHFANLSKMRKCVHHQGYFALMDDGSPVDITKKGKAAFPGRLNSFTLQMMEHGQAN